MSSDEDEEDAVICDACGDDASYEDNPILLCDGCDVALHTQCYGVKVDLFTLKSCVISNSKLLRMFRKAIGSAILARLA